MRHCACWACLLAGWARLLAGWARWLAGWGCPCASPSTLPALRVTWRMHGRIRWSVPHMHVLLFAYQRAPAVHPCRQAPRVSIMHACSHSHVSSLTCQCVAASCCRRSSWKTSARFLALPAARAARPSALSCPPCFTAGWTRHPTCHAERWVNAFVRAFRLCLFASCKFCIVHGCRCRCIGAHVDASVRVCFVCLCCWRRMHVVCVRACL